MAYKFNPNTNYPKNWYHHKPGEGLKLTKGKADLPVCNAVRTAVFS